MTDAAQIREHLNAIKALLDEDEDQPFQIRHEMSVREMVAQAIFLSDGLARPWDEFAVPSRDYWYERADAALAAIREGAVERVLVSGSTVGSAKAVVDAVIGPET